MYLIRCTSGNFTIAFTYAGALRILREVGRDASIHTLFGRWVGGRRHSLEAWL